MKSLKIKLIKIILLIGRKTFLGRGLIRKQLVFLITKILSTININLDKPLFKTKIWDFYINFYGDSKTGLKIYFGRNENIEINYLRKNFPSNEWFIDIGSNIGIYTLNILNLNSNNMNAKVLSIEPNKIVYDRLRDNISLLKITNNYINDNVITLNMAVGEKTANTYINTSYDHANAKIEKEQNSDNKKNLEEIKMDTLENIIKINKIENIYCIKVDTEGYEFLILEHFFKNVKINYYPTILIVEHNNDVNNKNEIDRFLSNFHYENVISTNSNSIYKYNEKES